MFGLDTEEMLALGQRNLKTGVHIWQNKHKFLAPDNVETFEFEVKILYLILIIIVLYGITVVLRKKYWF